MRQRDRMILSVIGAVLLLGGFWMLVLSPRLKESKKLSDEIAQTNEKVDEAKSETKEVKKTNVNFSKTYATLAKLGKAVPEAGSVDDDVPSLLLQLNQGGKVTKTGLNSFWVVTEEGGGSSPTAAAAAPAGQTPSQEGSAGAPASGASGAGGATGAASGVTLTEVSYKYSYIGTLYDLENVMNYVTNMVNVEGKRMKISGRLIAVKKFEFAILAGGNNPMLETTVDIATYTTPEGESIATGGGGAAGSTGDAASNAAAGSGSSDAVPGAPPQAQPATPPSASARRR